MSLNLIVSAGISVLMATDIDFGFMSMWQSHIALHHVQDHFSFNMYQNISSCLIMYLKYISMSHDESKICHNDSLYI